MSTATDQAKARAEISSEIFSDRLRYFVQKWAPDDPMQRDSFQHDMMRLFMDAMRTKDACLSYGIEIHAAPVFAEMAMRPLRVIMENPK